MTRLDDFFHKPTDFLPDPRLREWKRHLEQAGTSATLEVFGLESELGQPQPEMNLQFSEGGKQLPVETLLWDDDLNAGLIQLGVRAVSAEQEAKRFALGLRAALRKAMREFGDGYFNTVLLDLVKDSDLTHYPDIAEVVKHAYALQPNRDGKAAARYNLCREMIADALSGRAHELKEKLGYNDEEARSILVQALARYLDERFSVSRRRRLGLL